MQGKNPKWGAVLCLITWSGLAALGTGTNLWTGSQDTDWFQAVNWSETSVPGNQAHVRIPSGTPDSPVLTNATASLASFVIETGAVVTVEGWNSPIHAETLVIAGTLTHAAQTVTEPDPVTGLWVPQHRVWLQASNIHVTAEACVDADARGYPNDAGPGKGRGASNRAGGGGHGGHGGLGGHYLSYGGAEYDDLKTPVEPGSGGATEPNNGGVGGCGGGVIRMQASGEVRIDGTVRANGEDSPYRGGGGSGGSILIECDAFGGDISGILQADGGTQDHVSGSGGGGRISVRYTTLSGTPRLRFSTVSGGTEVYDPLTQWFKTAYWGTLFLTDLALLSEDLVDGRFQGVRLFTENETTWQVGHLVVSNTTLRLADDGMQVIVDGDLEVSGDGLLGIGADEAQLPTGLACGGNLVLTNGGRLSVYSGPVQNETENHGAFLDVAGDLWVHPASWLIPYSQEVLGGSVRIRAQNVFVAEGGGVFASSRGYRYGLGPGKGSISGERGGGGGFGGAGGDGVKAASYGGTTYGDADAPVEPGSGSGVYRGFGGPGGGSIRMEAESRMHLDGQLLADGGDAHVHSGGGSGGGVYLVSQRIEGIGMISASGGNGSANYSGGGGGGRVAIRTIVDRLTGETPGTYLEYGGAANGSISVAGSAVGYEPGIAGTFHLWRPQGTILLLK